MIWPFSIFQTVVKLSKQTTFQPAKSAYINTVRFSKNCFTFQIFTSFSLWYHTTMLANKSLNSKTKFFFIDENI